MPGGYLEGGALFDALTASYPRKSPAVKFIEEVSDSRGRCGLFPPAGCEDEEGMRSEKEGGGGGAEVRQAH